MTYSYDVVAEQPDEIAREKSPHVWVQYKGTDLCADVHCDCGEMSHIDDYFAYAVRCPYCRKVWALSMNVAMYPVDEDKWDGCGIKDAQP